MARPKIAPVLFAVTFALSGCGDPEGWYAYALDQLAGSTETKDPWPASQAARDIHQRAPVVIDMHADTLVIHSEQDYLARLLENPERDGHVDVPRLIEGNVALQVFSAYSKGSVDTLGDVAPQVTGSYVDDAGVAHSRYEYIRDPDILEYDDPNDRYVDHYTPWGLPRDVATYAFRVSRGDNGCKTWFDDGQWDPTVWGTTPAVCADFVRDDMYVERLRDVARRLRVADQRDSRLTTVASVAALDAFLAQRATNKLQVAALLSTEGLYFRSSVATAQGQNRLRERFETLYADGFRMFALTHFIDNDHAGSSTGMGRAQFGGNGRPLSDAGRLFAQLTLTHNAVLDVAHASGATIDALTSLAISHKKPIVYSHGGMQSAPPTESDQCANARNLTDAQIRAIASTGGVVGLGFAEDFVCGKKPIAWARAVRRAVDVIQGTTDGIRTRLYRAANQPYLQGVDHVGLGSDYDGGISAYTDVANLNRYTEALTCKKTWLTPNCLDRPFSEAEAHKILGGNVLRVLRANLPAN